MKAAPINDEIDIYDFYHINRAPKTETKHALDELIKIYLSTNSPIDIKIAIDIKNDEIYDDPLWSTNGVESLKEPVKFDGQKYLLDILSKYQVQGWEHDYTTEDPDSYQDGYGWSLMLQFEDGTVETYKGEGTNDAILPAHFDEFVNELTDFADERLGES